MPEFRYRIRQGHKHFVGHRRYGPGDTITFTRDMAGSDIAHKLESLDPRPETPARSDYTVHTLTAVEVEGGYDVRGSDGVRINRTPLTREQADDILAATTAPKGDAPAEFKRPYTMEQPGGVGGWVVNDAEGRRVHDKSRISKADAEALMAGNPAAE